MTFLNQGKMDYGEKLDLFLRYEHTRFFDSEGYSIHHFVDNKGHKISFYGTTKASPIFMNDIEVGDCVEVLCKFAKYISLRNGDEITQVNYVKIMTNKGKKSP
jgi:hypothetical protein